MEEIKSLPVKRQVSVSGILKKLGVSRSGYNAWKKRVPSDTSVRRTVLKEKIQKIYEDSHQNYGAPKLSLEKCIVKMFSSAGIVPFEQKTGCKRTVNHAR